jgi:competence protein ComEA
MAAFSLVVVGAATIPIAMSRSAPATEVRVRPVDLNTANVHELQLLPNVGPAIAARIVADREKHGPFASVDDLERVPGVGERTVRRLRDHASVAP